MENNLKTLKELREAREKTLSEVAARMGISIAFVSYLESGKRNLSINNAAKFARIYNVTLDEVYRLYKGSVRKKEKAS